MAGPIIVYRTKYARNDWWMFALYIAASAVVCSVLGYAMRRDEIIAARARAEHMARTLAVQFANAAATPGSDFAGTLPPLATVMGEQAHLEVVQSLEAGVDPRLLQGRYVGHSDVLRTGHNLDSRVPADRRAFELVSLARRELDGQAVILWREGMVSAAAVAPGGLTAIVDGLRPSAPGPQSALFALAAFAFLLVFGAGFQDVLYRLGQVLNFGVLAGVTWVFVRLGTALEPSHWRGVRSDPIVLRAESLKLADIARVMSQDLPPLPSAITEWGVRVTWVAIGFYLLALLGLWHRIGRVIGRYGRSYRYVSPAVGLFLVCAGAPLLVGLGLAFWRATPNQRSYLGFANFTAFFADTPTSPTSLWRTLLTTLAWVGASAALQLTLGLALVFLLAQFRGRVRGLYRALFFIPWALPGYVAALLWSHLWHSTNETVGIWLGFSDASWLNLPVTAFALNLGVCVWMGAPFLMAAGLTLIDRVTPEQWDAARLEGLTGLRRWRFLLVPPLRPLLAPAFAFSLFWSLNSFAVVDLVSGGGPDGATDLLVTRAYRWAFDRYEYGYAAAWSVVAFALAVLLSLAIRWLTRTRRSSVALSETPLVPTLALESR
jgi:ABC-type sugar transport system permease subunit